jgi:hypothetical protein
MTSEEVQQSISAAYDSVNIINEMILIESPTEDDLDIIRRNKEHLSIMMAKTWFAKALTSEQTAEINSVSL